MTLDGEVMDGRRLRDPVYPERDGKPMAESDAHRDAMWDAIHALMDRFADDPSVYVSGNNFVYFTEGVPSDCVSPDAYVVKGVTKHPRPIFKVWTEGARPCFVLEVTSKTTRREDLGDKMAKYRDDLRVPEYFLFDLLRDWIPEGLRGYVLEGENYRPVERTRAGRLPSRQLGLELAIDDTGALRFYEPGAASPIPTRLERAESERERADRERARADAAEREIARLKRTLEGERGKPKKRPKRRR